MTPETLTAETPIVEAKGLHRFYRRGDEEIPALRDVWLTVKAGEVVAIVGPSGSGKTTLLSLLAGLDNPDGGSVWIAGERFSHRSPADQARRRANQIGILTQSSGLIEHLTVAGNVRLAGSFRRQRSDPHPLLEELGIAHRARAWPSTLSGGETARANLAVALIGEPLVLLADEPTAEVSRHEETNILALLRRVRPEGGATIIVTHSAAVAGAADRTVHMTDGKLR
jgi:putative ABC transport system ATP-binding protein